MSKQNIVAHKVLSSLLGAEDLYKVMQPLLYDHSNTALRLYFKLDSLCTLAMLNTQLTIKGILLSNGIQAFIDTISRISLEFQKSEVYTWATHQGSGTVWTI